MRKIIGITALVAGVARWRKPPRCAACGQCATDITPSGVPFLCPLAVSGDDDACYVLRQTRWRQRWE